VKSADLAVIHSQCAVMNENPNKIMSLTAT